MVSSTVLGYLLSIVFGLSLFSSDSMPNASSLAKTEVMEKAEAGEEGFGVVTDLDCAISFRDSVMSTPAWARWQATEQRVASSIWFYPYLSRGPPILA